MIASALRLIASGALALAVATATPGVAQSGGGISALKNHNSNAPVDFAADRIELQDRADRVLLSGNVNVRQGDMTMNAARMTVAYTRAGSTDVKRLDASGNVIVQSPTETAKGNIGIYDLDRRLITMLGNVSLTQNANEVHGSRLVIDLNSGRATVDGSAVAGANGTQRNGGRVTGRFTVPQRNNGNSTGAGTPKP